MALQATRAAARALLIFALACARLHRGRWPGGEFAHSHRQLTAGVPGSAVVGKNRVIAALWAALPLIALIAAAIPLAATAHADDYTFFRSLENRGVSGYYTPDEALEIGRYLCGGLRSGRDFNSVYSDLVDYAYTRLGQPRGSLGQVVGAAWNQLCPAFSEIGRTVNVEYIPKGQRG